MTRISVLLIVTLLFASCSSVVFKNEQPINVRNLSSFPLEMLGMYTDGEKDSLIIREDGFYLASISENKTVQDFKLLSDSLKLRKGEKGYFLNLMDDKKLWHVVHIEMDGKTLKIAMIDTDDEVSIAKLGGITKVEILGDENSSTKDYLIDPTVEEFDEILNAGLFNNIGSFERVELFPVKKL